MKTGSPSSQMAKAQLRLTAEQIADFDALGIPKKLLVATHQLAPRLNLSALLPKLKTIVGATRNPAFPQTPWQLVLLSGDVQALEQSKPSLDWDILRCPKGLTPCHYTAHTGNQECLAWVCEQLQGETAELLKQKDNGGLTALHYAAHSGHQECLAWVCEQLQGETAELLKQTDNGGRTALHYTAHSGNGDCLVWIGEHLQGETAELLKQKDNGGRTALHYAAWSGNQKCLARVCEHLQGETAELLKQEDNFGRTALHWAARSGNRACLTWVCEQLNGQTAELLKQKANDGRTALHYAAFSGNSACLAWVCKQLEGETAELLKQEDDHGGTTLHYAAGSGNQACLAWVCEQLEGEIAELLKQKDNGGQTALHLAAESGSSELWSLLIQEYPSLAPYFWQPGDSHTPYSFFPTLLNLLHEEIETHWQALSIRSGKVTSDKQAYTHALKWFQQYAESWQACLKLPSEVNSSSDKDSFLQAVFEALATSLDAKADDSSEKRCLSEVARLPHPELKSWLKALVLANRASTLTAKSHPKVDIATIQLQQADKKALEQALDDCFSQYEVFIKQAKANYKQNNQIARLLESYETEEDGRTPKALTLEHGYVQLGIDDEAKVDAREQVAQKQSLNNDHDPGFRDKSFAAISQTEKKLGPHEVIHFSWRRLINGNHSYITGIAGIGKSTWGKYASYAWAHETDKTQDFSQWRGQFELVILFPLRHLLSEPYCEAQTDFTPATFIAAALYEGDAESSALSKALKGLLSLRINSHRVLFILDGFDEIATAELSNPAKKLLKALLQTPQVVVTSRPYYRQRLTDNYGFKPNRNQNFHILGFDEGRIQDFIEMFFEDYQHSSDRIEAVKAFLDNNSHIKQGCSIPILAELVCSVVSQWFDTGELQRLNERKTMTEVYSSVIDGWLLRYLDKFPEVLGEDSMPARDELCEGWASEQCGDELALLAYFAQKLTGEGKLASTIPLTEMERTVFGAQTKADKVPIILRKLNKLGMLKGILPKQHKVQQAQNLHYFPHKTFQEYFTAHYLVNCKEEKTLERFIDTHLLDNQYEVVWWFVAGLLRQQAKADSNNQKKLTQFFELLLKAAPKQFGVYYPSLLMHCWEEAVSECLSEEITQKLTDILIESLISRFNDYWETGETHYELFNTLKLCPHVRRHLYEEEKWRNAIKENIKTLQPDETCARQLKLLIECKLVERSFWHKGFLARVTESPLIVSYAKAIIENNQPLRNACWQRIAANLEIFIAAANRDDFDFDADCYHTEISSTLSELSQNPRLWTSGKAPQNQYWAAVFLARFLSKQYGQSAYDDLFDLVLNKHISDHFVKSYSLKSMLSQQAPGLGYLALSSMRFILGGNSGYNVDINAELAGRLAGELYQTYPAFPLVRTPVLNVYTSFPQFPPHSDYHDLACNWKLNAAISQIAVDEINCVSRVVRPKEYEVPKLKITCGLWWMLSFNETQMPIAMLDKFSLHSLSLSELWSLDFENETSWRMLFYQALSALTTEEKLAQWRTYYRLVSGITKLSNDCFQWLLSCYNKHKELPYVRYWLLTQISKTSNFENILFTEAIAVSMRCQYLASLTLSQSLDENLIRGLKKQATQFKNASTLSEKILNSVLSRHYDNLYPSDFTYNFSAKTLKKPSKLFMLSSDSADYDLGWMLTEKLSYGNPRSIDILDFSGQGETLDLLDQDEIRQMLKEMKVAGSALPVGLFPVDTQIRLMDYVSKFELIKAATNGDLLKQLYQSWSSVNDFAAMHERVLQYARGETLSNSIQSPDKNKLSLPDLVSYLAIDFQAGSTWLKPLLELNDLNFDAGTALRRTLRQLAFLFSAVNATDKFIVKGLRYHLHRLTMIYASRMFSQIDLSIHLAELLGPDINLPQGQLALMLESTPTRTLIEYALKIKSSNTGLLKVIGNKLLQAQQTLSIEDACLRLSSDKEPIVLPKGLAFTAQTFLDQLHLMISPEYAETLLTISQSLNKSTDGTITTKITKSQPAVIEKTNILKGIQAGGDVVIDNISIHMAEQSSAISEVPSKDETDIEKSHALRHSGAEEPGSKGNLSKQESTMHQSDKQSAVDKKTYITDEYWVISLMRKTRGAHQEHAFLFLEGREGNRSKVWFIDFVGKNFRYHGVRAYVPGLEDGKVRIDTHEGGLTDKLLFKCEKLMMDVRRDSTIDYLTWQLPRDKALALVEKAYTQQKAPPKFNILGKSSL